MVIRGQIRDNSCKKEINYDLFEVYLTFPTRFFEVKLHSWLKWFIIIDLRLKKVH